MSDKRCLDCNAEISFYAKICMDCHQRKKRDAIKRYYCSDCGKEITRSGKRCLSCAAKKRIEIFSNPFKGKNHTEETKRKIAKAITGIKHSKETRIKMSIIRGGDGNLQINKNTKVGRKRINWKKEIIKRDGHICQLCFGENNAKSKYNLIAHHLYGWKQYPELRFKIENGITLCSFCHILHHSRGNYNEELRYHLFRWSNIFKFGSMPYYMWKDILMRREKPIFLIDGNALAHKAYRTRNLKTSKGIETSVISGMLQMIRTLHEQFKYNIIIICWDSPKGSKYRKTLYKDYKGNRTKKEDSLIEQMKMTQSFFKRLHVRQVCVRNSEADDTMGMLAKYYSKQEYKVVIVSGDRDLWQLIDKNISIWISGKNKQMVDLKAFHKQMNGITPAQFLKMKALKGDTGDNIKGVNGIGNKRALELVKRFGTLKKIKNSNVDDRYVRLIQDNWDTVKLAYRLSEIIIDPIKLELEEGKTKKKMKKLLRGRKIHEVDMMKEIKRYEMKHRNFSALAKQLSLVLK